MKFVQARNYTPADRKQIDLIVIHTAECQEIGGVANNVASYFAGAQAPKASAHYVVDDSHVLQCVLEKDVAWHAGPVNAYSIGIEHAGSAKQNETQWRDPYSINVLGRSAELVAGLCRRYGISPERLTAKDLAAGKRNGICGHADVVQALQGGKGHWDPGTNFPWDYYIEEIVGQMAADVEKRCLVVDWDEHLRALRNGHPNLTPVECNGELWLVSSIYVSPVSIQGAADMARTLGFELPTPALVNRIWEEADLKVDPLPRNHNGTIAEMASDSVYDDQRKRIENLLANRSFNLLAGTHKDVVVNDGTVGIYGWHRSTGAPIQPFFAGHSGAWIDYSQGLRLVKRPG